MRVFIITRESEAVSRVVELCGCKGPDIGKSEAVELLDFMVYQLRLLVKASAP